MKAIRHKQTGEYIAINVEQWVIDMLLAACEFTDHEVVEVHIIEANPVTEEVIIKASELYTDESQDSDVAMAYRDGFRACCNYLGIKIDK